MKFLYAKARNILHGLDYDGQIDTIIEAVLVTTEPMLLQPQYEQFRFGMTIESAEKFSKDLTGWIEEAKSQAERITARPE